MRNIEMKDGFLRPSDVVLARALAAGTAETVTVPQYATHVLMASTADMYATYIYNSATDPSNLVTNGTFAADASWTKGTGWTIAAGVATATGAISTALSQDLVATLVPGKAYSVTVDVTRSAGTITPTLGGTAGTARSSSATFTETIVAGISDTLISFVTVGFTGTVDNVVITPVATVPVDTTGTGASELIKTNTGQFGGVPRFINNVATISLMGTTTQVATLSFWRS